MKKLTLITAIILLAAILIGQSFQIDIPGKEISPEIYKPSSKSDFHKQPYLIFEGINTQMRVIWQLDEMASCNIFWGTDITYSLGNTTTTEYCDDHQHGHTINGLTPGMKYYYKVVYDDAVFEASFKTAPQDNATDLKFFVYGDTRSDFENHNLNSQAMVDDYTVDPDFQTLSLFTGDHVFYGADEDNWTDDFFTNSAPFVRKRMAEVPFVSCLGNHELYGSDYSLHHDTELFGKYFPFPYVERRYWSFDYGPIHVAVLDQYPDYYQLLPLEGFLDSLQMVWLEQDLSSTDKPWKIIIIHEPGWSCEGSSSGYSHPNNPDVQNLLQPLCEQFGVQIVFAAHNHYYARACKNGVYHITTAGGGAPLYEVEEDFPNVIHTHKVHHYCKVEIEGDSLTLTAVKPDGEVIDEFLVENENRPDHLLGFLTKEAGSGLIDDVTISASGQITTADETGYYGLELVPGYHDATFLLSGYVPLTETVEVYEGTETQLDTMLMLGSGCLPVGITFTSQAQIDLFQTVYPGCTEIEGYVGIGGSFWDSTNISNLNGLNVLTSIGGYLKIRYTDFLTNLSGLESLTYIGGDLAIEYNDVLTNLSGLNNLTFIGDDLRVEDNEALTNFTGLESMTYIGGGLFIDDNDALTSLTGLEGLTTINGSLRIGFVWESDPIGNPSLSNITALENLTTVGEELHIKASPALTSLTGLEGLTSIGGDLFIYDNETLSSLAGLDNIDAASITELSIYQNSSLSTCNVQSICDYLASPNAIIFLYDNAPGCYDEFEVWNACFNSVDESYNNIDISISPNPVNKQAVFSLNNHSKNSVEICIYNTTGICLKSWQFQNQQLGPKEFKLDLKYLPAGIYFCRVQIGDEMVTKKIIKL